MDELYDEALVREHYSCLTKQLIEQRLTITTMESATAGQLASLITDTEGASFIFKGAYVTYSNEAKIQHGVPADIIEQYSVYSCETAEAMAKACRKAFGANIGIGVTGTMGNVDPSNETYSEPGVVYFAIDKDLLGSSKCESYKIELSPQKTRLAYKMAVAEKIYEILCKLLMK